MRVVIVGRDAALWVTAATLVEALGPIGVTIAAIELPSQLCPASVYSAWPAIEALHAKLGIDEAALLRITRGSFSLGYNVVPGGGAPFFLAHGAYGAAIDGNDFFGYWQKARRFGLDAAFEDFSPTAMAARHGRVLLPDAETETFGRTDYGYHLPAVGYVALLKGLAHRRGVAAHRAVAVTIDRDSETGLIRSARLHDGDAIAGDLFIDASGSDAVLFGDLSDAFLEDWKDYFPCDRRLTACADRFASIPAYAEVRLGDTGWTALHASQAATHVVHAFSGIDLSDDAALTAASRAAGLELGAAVVTPIVAGRRAIPWAGNCVAIGGAACALDPLFDLDLHAIQLGIVHLLGLFPTSDAFTAERAEYNRIMASLFDRLRDVQAAGYYGKAQALPATVAHKLETFRACGTIAALEDETFSNDQWRALFIGLGVVPESWPPAIDTTAPDRIKHDFRHILGFVREKVLAQPTHDAYLADLGARGAA